MIFVLKRRAQLMDGAAVVALLFVGILALVVGVTLSNAESEIANRVPVYLFQLETLSELEPSSSWDVTIVRRSGYVHSAWTVNGDRNKVIEFANAKMRQARIDTVHVVRNESRRMEVQAFYASTGHRRTGKYVGGFVITPKA